MTTTAAARRSRRFHSGFLARAAEGGPLTTGHWQAFLIVIAAAVMAAPASGENRSEVVVLDGHVVDLPAGAHRVDAVPRAADESTGIDLTVVLRRSDQAGFAAYLDEVYTARSPRFRRFLTSRELSDRFGPSEADYAFVRAWFERSGFTVTSDSANRMTFTVTSTRTAAAAALDVGIDDYALGERRFVANDRDPRLPVEVASRVQAVIGLSSLARPRPLIAKTFAKLVCTWPAESAGYMAEQLLKGGGRCPKTECEYAADACLKGKLSGGDADAVKNELCAKFTDPQPPPPVKCPPAPTTTATAGEEPVLAPGVTTSWNDVNGAGQTVGITAFSGYSVTDVADYLDLFGVPETVLDNLSNVHVNGGAALGPTQYEVLLDVDTVLVGASGAQVAVYDAPPTGAGSFQALFNRMIDDGVTIISNSWAYCEDQTTTADVQSIDSILATAAAAGISVFNATGDTGSTCLDGSANTVAVPAGSPHATAVGGTTLITGPAATHYSEEWWNGATDAPPTGQGGFGLSAFFPRPAYQDGFHVSSMRSVPDVVFNADPATGVVICQASAGGCPAPLYFGGTSVAAPGWAAAAALLNQALGQNLGNLNSTLYALASNDIFHTAAELGSDFAHVGLGSPKLNALLLDIRGATPGPVSAGESEVRAIYHESIADGAATSLVVVRLRDSEGNTVRGHTVTLEQDPPGSVVITPPSGVSDEANGAVIFEVTDATIEDATLIATDTTDGVELEQVASIFFVAPPASSGGIQAMPTTVAADGVSTTTITVTLLDENGMGAIDKVVTLDQGAGRSMVSSPTPATTDFDGEITFTATNKFTETVTYTAIDVSDGDLPVPGAAMVTFTNGSPQPCAIAQPMAAAGYAVSSFATSLPFGFFGGCAGAAGMAFDREGNLFVVDEADGHLYKFGPVGGVANASTRVTAAPYPVNGCVQGLAFSKDGEHLFMARQGCGTGGNVVEISPVDGHVIRIVAPNILCATGLATDPLSGDLFVSSPCPPGGPGNGGTNQIHRIVNPTAATPTVVPYSTPGHAQGLVFTPDGTLWATALRFDLNPDRRDIVKITGTDSPSPGQVMVLLSQLAADPLFVATNAVPELDPEDPGNPTALFVVNGNGGLHRLDLTQNPPARTPAAIGGDIVIFMIGGPDGCLYFDDMDRIVRVTAADGSCGFAPTTASPALLLSPTSTAATQGATQTLTALLTNVDVEEGTPVYFKIDGANPQQRMERFDETGSASITYTGVSSGADLVSALAVVEGDNLFSNRARIEWGSGPHSSFLTLTGPSTTMAGTLVTLVATLADVSEEPSEPIAGATIEFSVAGQVCSDATDADGVASCDVTPPTPGYFTLTAEFDGVAQHLPSSDSRLFFVTGNLPPCDDDCLDVDLDGMVGPLTDGLLILRYLFGFTGQPLVAGALGNGAVRTDPAAIVAYLDSIRATVLDLDLDGGELPLTDGLLLLRYLFGFRGAVLVSGAISQDCTRCDAGSVEGFLQSLIGE